MSNVGEAARWNGDIFEERVRAHKMALAQVVRVEDKLIELMRSCEGDPPPDLARRHREVLDEARSRVLQTAHALFPPGPATTQAIASTAAQC